MSNALTQIRSADTASRKEVELGIEVGKGSWHDTFSHSAYVYVGGLPLGLTEGDLLTICSQWGEIVHVDLCRDEETGKSKGFGFVAYEDQRSTVLAVDNLSGAKVGGRTLNVQHVGSYRKKKEELGLKVDTAVDEAEGEAGGGSASASGRSSEEEDERQGGGSGGAAGGCAEEAARPVLEGSRRPARRSAKVERGREEAGPKKRRRPTEAAKKRKRR